MLIHYRVFVSKRVVVLIRYRIFVLKKVWRVNSLSCFRFEKGLETEMAWKRLFNTLKKIFSHNWPPVIARRVYCHCAPSPRQNTRSVILRSNRRSGVRPVQSQMFHVKQNVCSVSHLGRTYVCYLTKNISTRCGVKNIERSFNSAYPH